MALLKRGKRQIGGRAVKPTGGKRADLGGLYVRSKAEANYARFLNWLQARGEILSWEYEPQTFDFPVKRGTRSYTPDFRIRDKGGAIVYHEVKGWMDRKSKVQLNRMRRHYPEVQIRVIDGKEIGRLGRQVGPLIPGWE